MKKRFFSGLIIMMLCMGLITSYEVSATEGNPVPKAKQSVVCILSGVIYEDGTPYAYDGQTATGTGFGVGRKGQDTDTFVTNCHVVSGIDMIYPTVYIMIDGADVYDESSLILAEVVYVDEEIDLAVLKTEEPVRGVTGLPLLPAETQETGDTVYALGFPAIADSVADTNQYTVEDITVTNGVLSRYLSSNGVKCMAHTATVNSGNSGGPLINDQGQVIGINTFIYWDDHADLRCYAIYIDYVMNVLDELGIPYTKANASGGGNFMLVILILAAAAVMGGVVVVVLKNKGKITEPMQSSEHTEACHKLRAVNGPLAGKEWNVKNVLMVGRDPSGAIVFPPDAKGISRIHCSVKEQQGNVMLTDLGSSYGTFVNGKKLEPNESVQIYPGTEITLGSDYVKFVFD